MKNILAFFFAFLSVFIFSQQQKNIKIKKYKVSVLSDSLQEISGLTLINNRLFTINDSGNSSDIFEIEKSSGKIIKKFQTSFKNIDWESIVGNDTYFFVGDFGNNSGNRKDLKIHKIPILLYDEKRLMDSYMEISFFYPEQKDFSPQNLNTDFDAEAMIFLNEKLHVFTKEWSSKSTSHYVVDPHVSENQAAQKLENFDTDFMVTDAAYFEGKLYLVGYTKGAKVYLQIFDESEPGIFFKNKGRKYFLGSAFSVGQIEGISVDKNGVYFSGEAFHSPLGTKKQAFYFVPAEKFR